MHFYVLKQYNIKKSEYLDFLIFLIKTLSNNLKYFLYTALITFILEN